MADAKIELDIEIEKAQKNLVELNKKLVSETDKAQKKLIQIAKIEEKERIRVAKKVLDAGKKAEAERLKSKKASAKEIQKQNATTAKLAEKAAKKAAAEQIKAAKEVEKAEKDFDRQRKERIESFKRGFASAAVAVAAVGVAISKTVDAARTLEDLETQFIAFTGSAANAAKQVERLAEFSASTPFQLEELANANRTLLAFGSSTEESFKQLRQLGDVAAATGTNVGDLAQIFGQIQVAGKLTGERFNQLAERGVNIGPTLAKSLGVAESELVELRRQGKITSDQVAEAFRLMTEEGGQFEGAMDRQSKTLSGAFSTAADNVFLLSANIGKQLTPLLVEVASTVTSVAQEFNKWLGTSDASKIAQLDIQIETLNKQLEETEKNAEGANEALSKPVGGGFLGASVKDINNAANQIDGSISSIEKRIADLKAQRDELEQSNAPEVKQAEEEEKAAVVSVDRETIEKTKQLNDELAVLRKQRTAVEQAQGAAESELLIEELENKKNLIITAEAEKNALLLEEQGAYEEASLLRAEQAVKSREALEKKAQKERSKQAAQARADEFDAKKQIAKAELQFEQQTWAQRAATTQEGLGAIASLRNSNNRQAFEIGKAAAVAQVLVDTPLAAQKAFTSLAGIPIVGPALGATAAAAAIVGGTARLNQIKSQQFQGFAEGGLVTGGVPGKDSVPAMLTPGEVVVPEKNFEDIGLNNDSQIALLTDIKSLLIQQSEQAEEFSGEDSEGGLPLSINVVMNEEVLASAMLEISRDNLRTA